MMSGRLSLIPGVILLAAFCCNQAGECQSSRVSHRPAKPKVRDVKSSAASKEDIEEIRKLMTDAHEAETKRMDELQQQNQNLAQQLKAAEDKLTQAEQKIQSLSVAEDPQIVTLQKEVAAVKAETVATTSYVAQEKKLAPERQHPLGISYKGVTITPGGFFAAETLFRSHAENADINSVWSGFPYDSQIMAHLTEFRATARQTRLSLRATGTAGPATLTGYFETDFLGSGFGANEQKLNGFSNRIRQLWGRAQFPNGWTFAGGQMWSLITTNRVGIENLSEFGAPTIDSSGFVGHDYAWQTAFRVTKSFFEQNRMTAAFSAENAATVGVTPGNVPSSVTNLLSGLSTTGSGALSNTTYSTNVAPDLIAKVAFDPGYGHYEIKAIGRTFRDRLDSTATTPGHNNTVLDGAIGGDAIVPVYGKRVTYAAEGMWGSIGRYGTTSTDVVVKPNGQLSPEKSLHIFTGFEANLSSRLSWYGYVADEYLPRNYGYGAKTINNSGCFIEAVATSSTPPSCSPSIRNLEGTTTGFWYRPYKGTTGMVQMGVNYIYQVKNTWVGVGGAPRGVENTVETSFRYYLP